MIKGTVFVICEVCWLSENLDGHLLSSSFIYLASEVRKTIEEMEAEAEPDRHHAPKIRHSPVTLPYPLKKENTTGGNVPVPELENQVMGVSHFGLGSKSCPI